MSWLGIIAIVMVFFGAIGLVAVVYWMIVGGK